MINLIEADRITKVKWKLKDLVLVNKKDIEIFDYVKDSENFEFFKDRSRRRRRKGGRTFKVLTQAVC